MINNNDGGHIESANADAIHIEEIEGSVTVNNVGSMETIYGHWDGIDIENTESFVAIDNTEGFITGENGQGIDLDDIDGTVTITNVDGMIVGGTDGIRVEDTYNANEEAEVVPASVEANAEVVVEEHEGGGPPAEHEEEPFDPNTYEGDGAYVIVNNIGGTIVGLTDDAIHAEEIDGTVAVFNEGGVIDGADDGIRVKESEGG
ncbi:MAG: hypothetical protein C0622_09130, partial [Desulfuromonas sp.]